MRMVSASVTARVALATSTRRWRLPERLKGRVPVNAQCGVSGRYSKLTSGFGRCPAAWIPATSTARAVRAARRVRLASTARLIASFKVSVDGPWPDGAAACNVKLAATRAVVVRNVAGPSIRPDYIGEIDERTMT